LSDGDFQVHNLFYGLIFIIRKLWAALELFRRLFDFDKEVKGLSIDELGFSCIFKALGLGPVLPDSAKDEVATILSFKLEGSLSVFIVWRAIEIIHPLFHSLLFRAFFFFISRTCNQSISLFELRHSFLFSTKFLYLKSCLERVEMFGHLLRGGCRSLGPPRVCFDLFQGETVFRFLTKHAD